MAKQRSFEHYLLYYTRLYLFLVFGTGFLAFGIYLYSFLTSQVVESIEIHAENTKIQIESEYNKIIELQQRSANSEFLINFIENKKSSENLLKKYFSEILSNDYINNIQVLDLNRNLIFSINGSRVYFYKNIKEKTLGSNYSYFFTDTNRSVLLVSIQKDHLTKGFLLFEINNNILINKFFNDDFQNFTYRLKINNNYVFDNHLGEENNLHFAFKTLKVGTFNNSYIILYPNSNFYFAPIKNELIWFCIIIVIIFLLGTLINNKLAHKFSFALVKLKEDINLLLKDNQNTLDLEKNINEPLEIFNLRENFSSVYNELLSIQANLELKIEDRTKELHQALNEANKATVAKSNFLASMSHELRTPMNGIIGMIELMSEEKTDAKDLERYSIIKNSAESLLTIINDILDFSKIEAGKLDLFIENFNLTELINEIYNLLRPRAVEKNLKFKVKYNIDYDVWIKSDSTRLRQLLYNIIGNAIKFTEAGSVIIYVHIDYDQESNNYKVKFNIKDTGIGIDPLEKDKLFHPFSQANNLISKNYGGTGLGLSICSKLVEMMKGSIHFTSTLGKGTSFLIDLEFQRGTKVLVLNKFKQKNNFNFRPLKILVAEDNLINQRVIQGILKKLGYKATLVQNGREAIKQTYLHSYDLIFMDLQMPDLNGIEATKEILKNNQDFKGKIIALTANVFEEDKLRCFEAGMDDFLSKPVNISQVSFLIQKHFEPIENENNLINYENLANHKNDEKIDKEEYNFEQISFFNLIEEVNIKANFMNDNLDKSNILDWEHITSIFEADENIYFELINHFKTEIDKDLFELKEFYNSKNQSDLKAKAHYIKGMCRNLGAKKLGEMFQTIEYDESVSIDIFEEVQDQLKYFFQAVESEISKLKAS